MRFRDLVDVYDVGGQWVLQHLLPNGPQR